MKSRKSRPGRRWAGALVAAVVAIAIAAAVALALTGSDDGSPEPSSARQAAPAATPPASPRAGMLRPIGGPDGCVRGAPGRPGGACQPRIRGMFDVGSLAVTPDGRFAYAVSIYSGLRMEAGGPGQNVPGGTVVAFRRDRDSGALSQLPGAAACTKDREAPRNPTTVGCPATARGLGGAETIALSPDGRFAYVAALNDSAIAVFERDEKTGALKQLGGDGACVEDERDAEAQGRECPVVAPGLHGVRWLAVTPDGRNLYASSPAGDSVAALRRDPETGALSPLAGKAACVEDRLARLAGSCSAKGVGLNYPRSLAVSPDGKNVYVASDSADASYGDDDAADGDAVAAFSRDPETGALTQLEGDGACVEDHQARDTTDCPVAGKGLLGAFSVTVSPDGRNVYVGSATEAQGAVAAFRRDPGSGALSQLEGDSACLGTRDCTRLEGLKGAGGLSMSGDGRLLYAADFYGLTVTPLQRDPKDGRLQPLPAPGTCVKDPSSQLSCPQSSEGLDGPRIVALSPDGKHAYVASSTGGSIAAFGISRGR